MSRTKSDGAHGRLAALSRHYVVSSSLPMILPSLSSSVYALWVGCRANETLTLLDRLHRIDNRFKCSTTPVFQSFLMVSPLVAHPPWG